MSVTVWIIDDDPDVAVHLDLVLTRAGYDSATIRTFGSAKAAFEAIDSVPVPDLVLVDQLLPDERGSDILHSLHAAHPTAVIRLITAAPDEVDAVDRAIGVVEKPPTPDVVKALLELSVR